MDHADHPHHSRIHVQKNEALSKAIAFFDFDGTITTKDSLAEFIRFAKGDIGFMTGVIAALPYIIGYKLGVTDRQEAKEKLLSVFFKGTPEEEFKELSLAFAMERIPSILRPGAVSKLQWHLQQGHQVVIVSASPAHWLKPWCDLNGFACISTELEVIDQKISGKINGRNCHGEEKVRRIHEKYDLSSYGSIYAYGDTSGDKPMLELAGNSFYKPFRN
jgi:phosphatidylglycerophosphatase C